MSNPRQNKRTISICLFGFNMDPEEVRDRTGSAHVEFHRAGDRRGQTQQFPKNFLAIWKPIYAVEPWDTHIDMLVDSIGGWNNLAKLIFDVSPEQAWLRLDVPAFGSPYIESNGLSSATIKKIADCGLGFELGIRSFDVTEDTHRAIAE